MTAGVIVGRDNRLLISRRPLHGLLGGLWEFPGGNAAEGETLPEALRRSVREALGIEIEVGRSLGKVNHAYTHFRITVHAFQARHLAGLPEKLGVSDHAWVQPEELHDYALGAKDHKIIELMDGEGPATAEAIDRDGRAV
jgi:A/G-specific adenine glycosylase